MRVLQFIICLLFPIVPIAVDSVTVDESSYLFPNLSNSVYDYSVATVGESITMTIDASDVYSCDTNFNGDITHFPTCNFTNEFPVTPVVAALTVSLYVNTDSPAKAALYTFNLRQSGCFVVDFDLSTAGLSNCAEAPVAWPLTLSCLASAPQATTTTLSFVTQGNCSNVVVQYADSNGDWQPCGPSTNGSVNGMPVQQSCPIGLAANSYNIIAASVGNASESEIISALNVTNGTNQLTV